MRAERGLTLLELLVVLAVLALVSGLAASAFGGRSARQQERDALAIGLYLQDMRAAAVSTGRVVSAGLVGERLAEAGGALSARPKVDASIRIRWQATSPSAAGGELAFFPDGSATPGEFELMFPDHTKRIAVDWTGGVRDVTSGQ